MEAENTEMEEGRVQMKKLLKFLLHIFCAGILVLSSNSITLAKLMEHKGYLLLCVPLLIIINIIPSVSNRKLKTLRLQNCADGCELLRLFLLSTAVSVIYSLAGWMGKLPLPNLLEAPALWVVNTLLIFLVELVVFWNGMLRIYLTSGQLGIRFRVLGAVCGMIPIVHLVVLGMMLRVVEKEVRTENQRLILDEQRTAERICETKYPILMVHGVFFRDFNYFNYWGRIPEALSRNGARIFYGNHQSAASVKDSALELAERIKEIVRTTGCEKVNIIAHSKGGLDCRYAVSKLDAAPYVASLTTINTPHRGCEFADYLLGKIPQKQQAAVAKTYNAALRKFGDVNPDFLEAVYDLTAAACKKRNEIVKDVEGIYYQSVGSKLNVASGGRFPLNFSYKLVHYFDGKNDGLVGEQSFPWGERYQFLTVKGKRGISHGDMIDLNRENFEEFDVREFYVRLVNDLKCSGL